MWDEDLVGKRRVSVVKMKSDRMLVNQELRESMPQLLEDGFTIAILATQCAIARTFLQNPDAPHLKNLSKSTLD